MEEEDGKIGAHPPRPEVTDGRGAKKPILA